MARVNSERSSTELPSCTVWTPGYGPATTHQDVPPESQLNSSQLAIYSSKFVLFKIPCILLMLLIIARHAVIHKQRIPSPTQFFSTKVRSLNKLKRFSLHASRWKQFQGGQAHLPLLPSPPQLRTPRIFHRV